MSLLAIFVVVPNPTVRQMLVVVGLVFVIGAVVTYRRPLFDRVSFVVQSVAFIVAEVTIYAFYINFRQPFHWANHLLPAIVVASIIYGIFLAVKKRPMRGEILLLIPLHIFAMIPDPMFSLNTRPHEEWMNIFVGHVWAHFLPYRLSGWLVLATLSSGLYVLALTRWLRRHSAEEMPAAEA